VEVCAACEVFVVLHVVVEVVIPKSVVLPPILGKRSVRNASTSPVSLPDLVSVDDEASMNETSDVSKVSVNESSDSLAYVLSSDDEVSVNEASGVTEVSVNETSVISEVSVNETSDSLTTVVSGDVDVANGHLSLVFVVYVGNSKDSSKGSAISE
jgi:hypothetical protein